MRNYYKIILIAFLVGIIIFGVYKYILSLKEQISALENEEQALLQTLEKERELEQKLTQENTELQDNLRVSEEKLAKLNEDFQEVHNMIEKLNYKVSILKAENIVLREKRQNLMLELARISQEKENLRAKLNSIEELKKAIKELKGQMHKIGTKMEKRVEAEKIIEGNRGFLIKDGKPTYCVKVKIEVKPPPLNLE